MIKLDLKTVSGVLLAAAGGLAQPGAVPLQSGVS